MVWQTWYKRSHHHVHQTWRVRIVCLINMTTVLRTLLVFTDLVSRLFLCNALAHFSTFSRNLESSFSTFFWFFDNSSRSPSVFTFILMRALCFWVPQRHLTALINVMLLELSWSSGRSFFSLIKLWCGLGFDGFPTLVRTLTLVQTRAGPSRPMPRPSSSCKPRAECAGCWFRLA